MENSISRIGNHVYVKGSSEAVELCKEAFKLEEMGKPWLDDKGYIIHQQLSRNGKLFLSICEDKYLPKGFINVYSDKSQLAMLFCVYFQNKDDLDRAYNLLCKDGKQRTEVSFESKDIVCDVVDRFGVFWHLRVPEDWNVPFVPK